MYNAKTVIDRMKESIKIKKITQKELLKKCGINENTLIRMGDKNGMSSFKLAKIADELNMSVDYLLGRTDVPETAKTSINNIQLENINGTICYNSADADKMVSDFIKEFFNLDFEKQVKAMNFVLDLKNKNEPSI